MLDKNPDERLIGIKAKKYIHQHTLSSVLCNEPFVKAAFLSKFISSVEYPVIYLDFDLLYSGYVHSNMIPKKENVSLFVPTRNDLEKTLKTVLTMILSEKSLVIIDSLNGFYNLFDEKDAGRLINAYIMLLTFIAKESDSTILVVSMARKNDQKEWVLSPTGRHVLNAKLMTKVFLKQSNSDVTFDVLGNDDSVIDSVRLFES